MNTEGGISRLSRHVAKRGKDKKLIQTLVRKCRWNVPLERLSEVHTVCEDNIKMYYSELGYECILKWHRVVSNSGLLW